MIKQFRIAFGLKMGSSILTFRARHDANAPEASLQARWRDRQFEKWAGLLPWKYIPWIEQGRKIDGNFWKMQMFLSKWISGIFSRILGYESRESGREIIPGMHIWAQLGFRVGGPRPITSLRGLIGCLLAHVGSSLICPLRAAYGIMHDYFTRLVLCTTILLD